MKFRNKIKLKKLSQIAFGLCLSAVFGSVSAFQAQAQTKGRVVKPKVQRATVSVNQNGYQPSSLRLKRGVSARLTFVRRTEQTCATEVVFPDYGIRRELPLNQAVVISLIPKKAGEFTFACGMNMVRGKLIVQ